MDKEKIRKILYNEEEIIWSGKPQDDSYMMSVFPIFSLVWLGIASTFMYEYFTALAPAKASNLLHGVMLSLLVTLPTWIGIGVFFAKVYERKKSILYVITNQRVIKHFGVFKSEYLFTDLGVIQSVTYHNDTFIHSLFKTGTITFGLGHHEYNSSNFLMSLDYLENAELAYRLFKLISVKLEQDYKFVNDPHPNDSVVEVEKAKADKKKAA